ncbi:hypothetical protein FXN63_09855 [Pigmentiphaga aceris]|uniref:RraA family protein n=1 Tax=Pigmentiphaga aceris TaxID=1940612 RepID=A0A5C0AV87_9BURK|nr:hypothetical protein FXN63_09855 [Pigmentiphaga aceris]
MTRNPLPECASQLGNPSVVPVRGTGDGSGEVGVDLSIGGIVIRAGEFVVIDSDGVVVLTQVLPQVLPQVTTHMP